MNNHTEELRKKYIQNPPEGMTADDVRNMSDNDLLDMDYFLHEDDLDDDFVKKAFISSNLITSVFHACLLCRHYFSVLVNLEQFPIK